MALTCPSCNGHTWPDKTRGLRNCPLCLARIALTKDGAIRQVLTDTEKLARMRVLSDWADRSKRPDRRDISRILSADRMDVTRTFKVARPSDLTIACAVCAHMCSLFTATEGTALISVDETFAQIPGKPSYDTETGVWHSEPISIPVEPTIIRGVICVDCQTKYDFRPRWIRSDYVREFRKSKFHKPDVLPSNYNARYQRLEYDSALVEIEKTRRNLLDSGIPQWAAHDEAIRLTSLLPGCWAHTFRGDIALGSEHAIKLGRPVSPDNWDGIIPRPTISVYRPDDYADRLTDYDPLPMDHVRPVKRAARLTVIVRGEHYRRILRPAKRVSDGIARVSLKAISAMLYRPPSKPIPHGRTLLDTRAGWSHRERKVTYGTLPKPSAPMPDPPMPPMIKGIERKPTGWSRI